MADSARIFGRTMPDSASAPTDDWELNALETAIAQLTPRLAKLETATSLKDMLNLVAQARTIGKPGHQTLKTFAMQLRMNRMFDELFLLTSQMRLAAMADADITRWEIQALIELGVFETALELARPMALEGPKTNNGREGYSAIGRVHKQRYMDAATGKLTLEPEIRVLELQKSYEAYARVWNAEKNSDTAYHGVNALAVAQRAKDDGTPLPGVDLQKLARDIISTVSAKDDVWSLATHAEACLALDEREQAMRAYTDFALHKEATPFKLGAALRQLQEVWKINGDDKENGGPVRLLKTVMLSKQGQQPNTGAEGAAGSEVQVSAKEAHLIEQDITGASGDATSSGPHEKSYERLFSDNAPISVLALRNAMSRARSVCRIHALIGGEDRAFGTGFAIRGSLLHESWGDDPVIVTNNHVVSTQPGRMSQLPEYCEAMFVCLESMDQCRVRFDGVLWESDETAHDITILKIAGALPEHALPITQTSETTLPPRAVDDNGIGRVYVIGFPAAGELSFSFADNRFLDHDAAQAHAISDDDQGMGIQSAAQAEPVRLHYRTPTLQGSSGSPVFNFNDFELMAVHHAGSPEFNRLKPNKGVYAANEGIWIKSICCAIAESLEEDHSSESANLSRMSRKWRAIQQRTATPFAASAVPPEGPQSVRIGGGAPTTAPPRQRYIPGAMGGAGSASTPSREVLKSGTASAEEMRAFQNESIIGLDDRTRIFDTQASPWRMVCAIRCYWGSTLAVGTGFLIGPGILLTAGHVVYPRMRGAFPDRIEIFPGLNGATNHFEAAEVHSVSVHPGWKNEFQITRDVAAIHLSKPVGENLGWFGVASRQPPSLQNVWTHVTGYPGEKQDQLTDPKTGAPLPPIRASQLWHHSSPCLAVRDERIFYSSDTTAGQSGAPIYILDKDTSDIPIVVGIHAYGNASTPTAIGQANSGAWIGEGLFDLIETWRAESTRILNEENPGE